MASKMEVQSKSWYKKKAPGLASRSVRAKLKKDESKAKRDELLISRRRIPLSVIQEEEKKCPTDPKKLKKEQQSEDRLKKLREWQRAKETQKKTQKKTLVKSSTIKPWNAGVSASSNVQKKTTTSTKPPPLKSSAVKPLRSKVQPVKSAPTTTKSSAPPAKSKTLPPKRSVPSKSTVPPKSTTTVKPPTKKQPVTAKPEVSKTVKSRPQTRSMTKSAVSKVKAESKSSCSTKITARKVKPAPPKRTVTKHTTKDTAKSTVEMMDISIEITNEPLPPVTPTKNSRYDPVKPSPLLTCHSASLKRHQAQLFGPPPITDPTWIPGQSNPAPFAQPNFDEAFTDFSPFKFGDSNSRFQFTFRKECSEIFEDSLDNDDAFQAVPMPDAAIVRKSLDREQPEKRRSVHLDSDNAMIVEVNNEVPTEVPQVNVPQVDVEYFRRLHSDAVVSLISLADKWDKKEESLREQLSDEILGQVCTTVGQARLLVNQKLKQYLNLVAMAENQSGERETTSEDLQGFWDMVHIQVEDVCKKFSDLASMEQNNWSTMASTTPKKKKVTKKRKGAVKSSSTEESERAIIARQKREEQRNKLKELRKAAAAKRAREEAGGNDTTSTSVNSDVACTTPTKKSRVDELMGELSDGGSAYKNGRRRSLRLRNVSVFSPAPLVGSGGTPHKISSNDVPVASLISFD